MKMESTRGTNRDTLPLVSDIPVPDADANHNNAHALIGF